MLRQCNEVENKIFAKVLESIQFTFDYDSFSSILTKLEINTIEDFKYDSLDLLIAFSNFILMDDEISESEIQDYTFLKKILKIKEGDFVKYKNFEINEILKREFLKIYADNFVDEKELILNVNLQSLFDLSYDDFEKIKKDEIMTSLILGADPKDLDITKLPKGYDS